MRKFIGLVFMVGFFCGNAADPYPKNSNIDVRHYQFQLELNDSTDVISGKATVTILFKKAISEFELDLVNKTSKGVGMSVSHVFQDGNPLKFMHQKGRIKIILKKNTVEGEQSRFVIDYAGVPQEGLIIGKNKFGDRTFFGDNWPNRGHHWIPCIDHPSDKARVDFVIIAPEYYQVVASGRQVEESVIDHHRKLTHWEENIEIPVKVMTIGVARFAVQLSGEVDHIPVSTWVFPQNRIAGFSDFAVGPKIIDFFHNHIGPYAYEKLAHVQSMTRWGGLENASNIFYSENSVNGKNENENIIAHETAHQWFGNSVTEGDWHHVWLSEGFATYFANLYMEYAYGHDKLVERAKQQRTQAVEYLVQNPSPVIDTTLTDIDEVLNVNTYQKAGWVLHMLRHEMGETAFWKGIQQYYQTYRNGNAMTADFQRIMEGVSEKDLSVFFEQWLWKGGHPKLSGRWNYDPNARSVIITIDQIQAGTVFKTPLDIGLRTLQDGLEVKTVLLNSKSQKFSFPAEKKPMEVILDPLTWLFFEGEILAK